MTAGLIVLLAVVCSAGARSVTKRQSAVDDAFYILANSQQLLRVDVGLKSAATVLQSSIDKGVVAIDYDASSQKIFFCSNETNKIYKTGINANDAVEIIVGRESGKSALVRKDLEAQSLAVDWIKQKLYWIDNKPGALERSDFDGSNYVKIKTSDDLKNVESMVIIPSSSNKTVIYVARKDAIGKVEVTETSKGKWPVKVDKDAVKFKDDPARLAVDHSTKRLYWVDKKDQNSIISFLDGTDKSPKNDPFSGLGRPVAIAVYQSTVVWIDEDVGKNQGPFVRTANATKTKSIKHVVSNLGTKLSAIAAYSKSKQQVISPTSGSDPTSKPTQSSPSTAAAPDRSTPSTTTKVPTQEVRATTKAPSQPTQGNGKDTAKPNQLTPGSGKSPTTQPTQGSGKDTAKPNRPTQGSGKDTKSPTTQPTQRSGADTKSPTKPNQPTQGNGKDTESPTKKPSQPTQGSGKDSESPRAQPTQRNGKDPTKEPVDESNTTPAPVEPVECNLDCENGGECEVVEGEAVCNCPEDFEGANCQDAQLVDGIEGQGDELAGGSVGKSGGGGSGLYIGAGVGGVVVIAVLVALVVFFRRRSTKKERVTEGNDAVLSNPTYDTSMSGRSKEWENPTYDENDFSPEKHDSGVFDDQLYEAIPGDKAPENSNCNDYQDPAELDLKLKFPAEQSSDYYLSPESGPPAGKSEYYLEPSSSVKNKGPLAGKSEYYLEPSSPVKNEGDENPYDNGTDLSTPFDLTAKSDAGAVQTRPLPAEPVYDNN